jgi:hypothetical protein
MRQGAQDIIVFGMERYQATGDAGYLTRLYQAAVNITGLNATRMKRYIVAHANVHLTKAKDGQWVFSKTGKGANEAKPLAGNWWEWEVQRAPSTKFDLAARILSVANALEKAIDDPTITVSTADVDAALASLKSAIAKAQRRPDLKLAA